MAADLEQERVVEGEGQAAVVAVEGVSDASVVKASGGDNGGKKMH